MMRNHSHRQILNRLHDSKKMQHPFLKRLLYHFFVKVRLSSMAHPSRGSSECFMQGLNIMFDDTSLWWSGLGFGHTILS